MRCPVRLMTDMLQDPEHRDSIDWSGASPSPGKYSSVTSGSWWQEVKVLYFNMTSCDLIWCNIISRRNISKRKAKMSSYVLLSWDPTPPISRSRARRRRTMCTSHPAWCTFSIVKKWMVCHHWSSRHDVERHHMTSYSIIWCHMTPDITSILSHRLATVRSNTNHEGQRSWAQAKVIYSRHSGCVPRGYASNIKATWGCCAGVC